jgi:hypothetical protein
MSQFWVTIQYRTPRGNPVAYYGLVVGANALDAEQRAISWLRKRRNPSKIDTIKTELCRHAA